MKNGKTNKENKRKGGLIRLGFCGEEMKNFCCFVRENEEDERIGDGSILNLIWEC